MLNDSDDDQWGDQPAEPAGGGGGGVLAPGDGPAEGDHHPQGQDHREASGTELQYVQQSWVPASSFYQL